MATQSLYFLEKYHLSFEYLKCQYKQILTQDIYPFSLIFVSIALINNKNNFHEPRYFHMSILTPAKFFSKILPFWPSKTSKTAKFPPLNILNNTSIAHPPILSNKQQK